jgi:hypothetical protein
MHKPARILRVCTAAGLVALSAFAQDGAVFKDDAAAALFGAARGAIGHGEGRVLALQSLVLKGRSRVTQDGQGPVDCAVEIRILLPDRYLRMDVASASRMITGFSGESLLTAIEDRTEVSVPPPALHASLIKLEQARLARLLLGMAAYVSPRYFITFRSIATMQIDRLNTSVAVSGQGEANVLEGAGRDGFFIRMFVDVAKRPTRIEYRVAKGGSNTMSFADRREVSGLQLPFKITTADAKRTIDALVLSDIQVNPTLGESDFVVGRPR